MKGLLTIQLVFIKYKYRRLPLLATLRLTMFRQLSCPNVSILPQAWYTVISLLVEVV
jgi:hypothetical protein